MKNTLHVEEQIFKILNEHGADAKVAKLSRFYGDRTVDLSLD